MRKVSKEEWLKRFVELGMTTPLSDQTLNEMESEGIEFAIDEENYDAPQLLTENWVGRKEE